MHTPPARPNNWHRGHKQTLSRGERAADYVRNGMGSWRFVCGFSLGLLVWALINSIVPGHHWDPYPFILLNLALSTLAALQGAILLIAAKRQDSINAAMAEHDYQTDRAAKHEIDILMEQNQRQLTLLSELKELAEQQPHSRRQS